MSSRRFVGILMVASLFLLSVSLVLFAVAGQTSRVGLACDAFSAFVAGVFVALNLSALGGRR